MSAKHASVPRSSKTRRLSLKKETPKNLAVKSDSAREVRGNISTIQRLGNNYGC